MNKAPRGWRLKPASIKSYAMVFIGLVVLLFGALNWAMLNNIGATRSGVERSNQQAAEMEISQAMVQLTTELVQVGNALTGWDETRQQLDDPSYYTYWRDNRVLAGGITPDYVTAVELYSRRGDPLANSVLPGMPGKLSGGERPFVQRQGGLDYLYLFSPVPDGGGDSRVSGYAVIKLDFLAALRNVQRFRHADPRSVGLQLSEGARVPLDQAGKKIVFSLLQNQEIASLLQAMSQSQLQMVFIVLLMSWLLYVALSRLVAKPLRRLSRHIDTLRAGGGG